MSRVIAVFCVLCIPVAYGASLHVSMHDTYLMGRIDQLVVIADAPTMRKPYSVNAIRNLLPEVELSYPGLYAQISNRLDKYESKVGLSYAQIELSLGDVDGQEEPVFQPNARGESVLSAGHAVLSGHAIINDWLAISVGGQWIEDAKRNTEALTDSRAALSGSYISVGADSIQLDVGYKERWLSPLNHSAMLLSTNAATPFSIGLSNPISLDNWWGFEYDIFVMRLGGHENIRFNGELEKGEPAILGTQFSISPIKGWRIAATRTMQFGGGPRDVSFGDVWDAFLDPVANDNTASIENCDAQRLTDCELGNQLAALSSSITFPGETPFSVYFEYAGEDSAGESNLRLGNLSVSGGLHIPFMPSLLGGDNWSLNYEVSEWQNAWYVHGVYRDGYTHNGGFLGHWGAEQRTFNEGAGARSQTLKIGRQMGGSRRLELTFSDLNNKEYFGTDYSSAHRYDIHYFHNENWQLNITSGKATFGGSFWRGALIWKW